MSLTAYRIGAPSIAGFKLHTNNWNTTNTGTALGSGDGFLLLPDGTPRTSMSHAENNATTGGAGIHRVGPKVTEGVAGSFKTLPMYSGCQRLFASLFGTESVSASGSGYAHVFTMGIDAPRSGDLCWTDLLDLHEIPMTKVSGFSMDLGGGALGSFGWDVIGKRELIDDSGANTLSGMSSVTLPSQPAIPYLLVDSAQCVVRCYPASSGALDSSAAIAVNGVSLSAKRSYATRRSNLNAPYIDEPIAGNWIAIEGTLKQDLDDDTIVTWADVVAGTEFKMDIAFTGTTIGGGASWKFLWQFPSVLWKSDGFAQVNKTDLLERSLPFTAHLAASAPTGMAFTAPRLTITDTTALTHMTNGA